MAAYADAYWEALRMVEGASILIGGVSDAAWRQAVADGHRFLDQWGSTAAWLGWKAAIFSFLATTKGGAVSFGRCKANG
jgi:hypothetical protein